MIRKTLVAGLAVAALLVPSVASAGANADANADTNTNTNTNTNVDTPPLGTVGLMEPFTTGGRGCPTGTVGPVMSDDATSMALYLDRYGAAAGPGIPSTEMRTNCRVRMRLRVPAGFSFAIASSQHRGFLDLEESVSATLRATHWFAGARPQEGIPTRYTGPTTVDFRYTDEFAPAIRVFSPCGVNPVIDIASTAVLDNRNYSGRGILTGSRVHEAFELRFNLVWRRCTQRAAHPARRAH